MTDTNDPPNVRFEPTTLLVALYTTALTSNRYAALATKLTAAKHTLSLPPNPFTDPTTSVDILENLNKKGIETLYTNWRPTPTRRSGTPSTPSETAPPVYANSKPKMVELRTARRKDAYSSRRDLER